MKRPDVMSPVEDVMVTVVLAVMYYLSNPTNDVLVSKSCLLSFVFCSFSFFVFWHCLPSLLWAVFFAGGVWFGFGAKKSCRVYMVSQPAFRLCSFV